VLAAGIDAGRVGMWPPTVVGPSLVPWWLSSPLGRSPAPVMPRTNAGPHRASDGSAMTLALAEADELTLDHELPKPRTNSRAVLVRWREKVSDVPTPSGCWLWTGGRDKDGYGRFSVGRQHRRAHHLAYILFVGPIPDGLEIDHLCRNPGCVNPWHLEPVPQRVNVLRGTGLAAVNARKTHCINGHEFTLANTYVNPSTGNRRCQTCHRDEQRRRVQRLRMT
jgi:HNH endonuclease